MFMTGVLCTVFGAQVYLNLLRIWTLLPNFTFYLIVYGFDRTFAPGAACQQRTLSFRQLVPSTFGLKSVLIVRQITSKLVLFPDF